MTRHDLIVIGVYTAFTVLIVSGAVLAIVTGRVAAGVVLGIAAVMAAVITEVEVAARRRS